MLFRSQEEIRLSRNAVQEGLVAGDANQLKEAVERLDRATETLAARLVEMALAARQSAGENHI